MFNLKKRTQFSWSGIIQWFEKHWIIISSISIILILISINCYIQEDGSFWLAIEDSLIVLSGEFHEKHPTVSGRVLQLVSLIFGAVLFGLIVGKISSIFVSKELIRGKKVKKYNNHYVICNWNKNAIEIINELHKGAEKSNIIVIANNISEKSKEIIDGTPLVDYTIKDPTDKSVLEEYNVSKAKSVILLADEFVKDRPDEKNALIALSIEHLKKQEQRQGNEKETHIISELIDMHLKDHLKYAGVNEIICNGGFSRGIIAQSAIYNNISEIYTNLLTYSDDTNEIYYVKKFSDKYAKTFKKAREEIIKIKENIILLGIKKKNKITEAGKWKGKKVIMNPNDDQQIEEGDELIVLAFDEEDLKVLNKSSK